MDDGPGMEAVMHTPGGFRSTACVALLTLVVMLASALPASAQAVRGRVVEADTNTPVGSVTLTVFGSGTLLQAVEADSLGSFEFALPAAGEYTLIAVGDGYKMIGPVPFSAPAGRALSMTVRMARDVVILDPLEVTVRAFARNSLDAARQRSTDNRHFGVGFHMNREEIVASKRPSTIQLIESMTPIIRFVSRRPEMAASGRGYSPVPGQLPEDFLAVMRQGSLCPLALYVDGIHILGATPDALPAPDLIDTVEIYPGTHPRSGYVDRNNCGLALIWTRADAQPSRYRRTLLGSLVLGGMAALAAVVMTN
jgi:hypothetical protein